MAEEDTKLEESGLETILAGEPNGVEGQEGSQRSVVEEAVGESGGSDQGAVKEASDSKGVEKGKGWLTNLPVELRDGIDTEKYHSVADYIRGLREEISNREPKPEPETDEAWAALSGELAVDGETILGKDTFQGLRDIGLTTKQAKGVYDSMQAGLKSYADAKSKEIGANLMRLQGSIAGTDPKSIAAFKSTLKRGMDAVAKANPEMYAMGLRDNAFLHPAVASMLYMVGLEHGEGYSPSAKPMEADAGGVTQDNPFGLR